MSGERRSRELTRDASVAAALFRNTDPSLPRRFDWKNESCEFKNANRLDAAIRQMRGFLRSSSKGTANLQKISSDLRFLLCNYGTFPVRFGRSQKPTTRTVRGSPEHSPSSPSDTVSTTLKNQRNSTSVLWLDAAANELVTSTDVRVREPVQRTTLARSLSLSLCSGGWKKEPRPLSKEETDPFQSTSAARRAEEDAHDALFRVLRDAVVVVHLRVSSQVKSGRESRLSSASAGRFAVESKTSGCTMTVMAGTLPFSSALSVNTPVVCDTTTRECEKQSPGREGRENKKLHTSPTFPCFRRGQNEPSTSVHTRLLVFPPKEDTRETKKAVPKETREKKAVPARLARRHGGPLFLGRFREFAFSAFTRRLFASQAPGCVRFPECASAHSRRFPRTTLFSGALPRRATRVGFDRILHRSSHWRDRYFEDRLRAVRVETAQFSTLSVFSFFRLLGASHGATGVFAPLIYLFRVRFVGRFRRVRGSCLGVLGRTIAIGGFFYFANRCHSAFVSANIEVCDGAAPSPVRLRGPPSRARQRTLRNAGARLIQKMVF